MSAEAIAAIRAVRIAAHELHNVCAATVGGVSMAVSKPSVHHVGEPTRGLSPKPLPSRDGGDRK